MFRHNYSFKLIAFIYFFQNKFIASSVNIIIFFYKKKTAPSLSFPLIFRFAMFSYAAYVCGTEKTISRRGCFFFFWGCIVISLSLKSVEKKIHLEIRFDDKRNKNSSCLLRWVWRTRYFRYFHFPQKMWNLSDKFLQQKYEVLSTFSLAALSLVFHVNSCERFEKLQLDSSKCNFKLAANEIRTHDTRLTSNWTLKL